MNFTEVKRGYDPEEVDNYINSLNNVIKSYKEKDNAIKNAIISAQVAADNMVKNAKLQANEYKVQIVRELDRVRREVEREREKVLQFQELYTELVHKYLLRLEERDITRLLNCLDGIDGLIDNLTVNDLVSNQADTSALELKMPPKTVSRQHIDEYDDED